MAMELSQYIHEFVKYVGAQDPTVLVTAALLGLLMLLLVNHHINQASSPKSKKRKDAPGGDSPLTKAMKKTPLAPFMNPIKDFMVMMPDEQEPGQMMEATAPDGQIMKFAAPDVMRGNSFSVAYKVGGSGGEPPVDTTVMLASDRVLSQFEVNVSTAADLVVLKEFDIILLADDSGSMRQVDAPSTKSRWVELVETVKLIVSVAGLFDDDGLDVYFLNRQKVTRVTQADDGNLSKAFLDPPRGSTPLTEKLEEIVSERERLAKMDNSLLSKPVLLMIFTDGQPNGGAAKFAKALKGVLTKKTTNLTFRCQILPCTGKDEEIAWLKPLDEELAELDVTDDYLTEKKEAEAKPNAAPFTRGDWCMKAMLGAVLAKYDQLDE
jgi:hypothetical protein